MHHTTLHWHHTTDQSDSWPGARCAASSNCLVPKVSDVSNFNLLIVNIMTIFIAKIEAVFSEFTNTNHMSSDTEPMSATTASVRNIIRL